MFTPALLCALVGFGILVFDRGPVGVGLGCILAVVLRSDGSWLAGRPSATD